MERPKLGHCTMMHVFYGKRHPTITESKSQNVKRLSLIVLYDHPSRICGRGSYRVLHHVYDRDESRLVTINDPTHPFVEVQDQITIMVL